MSFIQNTAFEARITNGRFDDLINIAGKSSTDEDISAGVLCVRMSVTECEGISTTSNPVANENSWSMAPVDVAQTSNVDVVYACNPYDWEILSDGRGNAYSVGRQTLGLGLPAGRYGTFTRIDFDNQCRYRFGEGNFSEAPGENYYATIANGLLVPAAAAPQTAGSVYFEIVGTGNFIEGTTNAFTYYDVVAKKVPVSA